ncbi:uncharacterized protein LOC144879685 [Branchiostoma floridae x Branchiostoma japonicum]
MGYNVRAAWCLGILLVLLGCVSLLTGIVGLAVCYGYCAPLTAVVGAPIWSSVMVIAAGALAIASAREPSNGCKITGFLTCSLLAMVLTLVTWVLGVIDSTLDTSRDDYIRIVDYVIPTAAANNTAAPPAVQDLEGQSGSPAHRHHRAGHHRVPVVHDHVHRQLLRTVCRLPWTRGPCYRGV